MLLSENTIPGMSISFVFHHYLQSGKGNFAGTVHLFCAFITIVFGLKHVLVVFSRAHAIISDSDLSFLFLVFCSCILGCFGVFFPSKLLLHGKGIWAYNSFELVACTYFTHIQMNFWI